MMLLYIELKINLEHSPRKKMYIQNPIEVIEQNEKFGR